jgi:hypothetical protein
MIGKEELIAEIHIRTRIGREEGDEETGVEEIEVCHLLLSMDIALELAQEEDRIQIYDAKKRRSMQPSCVRDNTFVMIWFGNG